MFNFIIYSDWCLEIGLVFADRWKILSSMNSPPLWTMCLRMWLKFKTIDQILKSSDYRRLFKAWRITCEDLRQEYVEVYEDTEGNEEEQ